MLHLQFNGADSGQDSTARVKAYQYMHSARHTYAWRGPQTERLAQGWKNRRASKQSILIARGHGDIFVHRPDVQVWVSVHLHFL